MRRLAFLVLLIICLLKYADSSSQIREGGRIDNTIKEGYKQELEEAYALREHYPDSSRRRLLHLLQQYRWGKNREGLRTCLIHLSSFTDIPACYEQTLRFARQGIQLCDTQQHKRQLVTLYTNMGQIYHNQTRFKDAFEANLKAAGYARAFPLTVARIENNMSDVLVLANQPHIALIYLERTLKTAIQYQDAELLASSLANIARLKEDTPHNAFTYLDSSLRVARRFKLYTMLYRGMVNKSSILARSNRPGQALQLLQAADTIAGYTTLSPILQSKALEVAGTAYAQLGQYTAAEQKLRESLRQTDEYSWLSIMNQLTDLYVAQGNFPKAYHTYRLLRDKMDTITRHQMNSVIQNLDVQYRTAEKDKQLTEQQLLLVKKENTIKLKNLWMVVITFGGAMALGMVLLMRRNYAQKQKTQLSEQDNLQLRARLEGEERERKRISQELHDGIGGILSAAKMNLTAALPVLGGQGSKYELGVHLLDDAYYELRRTAHNLSPHLLKSKGLAAALESYCRKTAEAQLINLQLHVSEELHYRDDDMGLTIYRIIQELLQNIVKHSGASIATVEIGYQKGLLDITVEDNGKGFPEDKAAEGIGLSNIRDRIKALSGSIEIDSRPDEGSTIYVFIPLEPGNRQV